MSTHQLFQHFSDIPDHRQQGKIDHLLFDILFLTVSAVIAGSQGWEDIEDFGHDRLDWLRKYAPFENGIPRHDTIARVISAIDLGHFQKCFSLWMKDCQTTTEGQVVAIDGKRLRGSFNQSNRRDAIHMVSAFACENKLVLAQTKTDKKSNEITAIPKLLDLLEIKGCLVTIDAMGCQKEIVKKVREKEADYLIALKGNQGTLFSQVEALLKPQIAELAAQEKLFSEATYERKREEIRWSLSTQNIDNIAAAEEWLDLKTVGVIVSYRQETGKKQSGLVYRYYISSANLDSETLANKVREHWGIENGLHWKLDVGMNEDQCRIRREGAPEIFGGIRHVALNQLNEEKTFKKGVRAKQMKAARSIVYLEKVLFGK